MMHKKIYLVSNKVIEFTYIDKCIIFQFGEKGSGTICKGDVQDFYKLREECLKNHVLFEDPNFPADVTSISYSSKRSTCVWERPTVRNVLDIYYTIGTRNKYINLSVFYIQQVHDNPQMFVDGASRFDVKQGYLSDCWLAASIAGLARYRALLVQVVPDDQGFNDKYAGIFHFRY